jgi:hypothetical protein
VKQGYGSFLTFEFGEPVRERGSEREGLRSATTSEHGEWHLWVYCCHWRVLQDGAQLAWSEDDRDTIGGAMHRLNGQKLFSVNVAPQQGRSDFRFDLGGSLETWPYGGDPTDEQWMLFAGQETFTYRADGRYSQGPSHAAKNVVSLWLAFP